MTQPPVAQQTCWHCQQTRWRCDVMVMTSRRATKSLTSTNAHTAECHNCRSEPIPLKMFRWGAFLTPGGSRQVFFERGAR